MLKRYMPLIFVLILLFTVALVAVKYVQSHQSKKIPDIKHKKTLVVDYPLYPVNRCEREPHFLVSRGIASPIIDLTQSHVTGIGLWYGKGYKKLYHPKQWEQYGHLGTFALDRTGNIYLAPTPFVSIKKDTFEQQTRLYRIDSDTGTFSIWKTFDDVHPSGQNPYGVVSVVYDCTDDTLWVAAIDESDFHTERGVIYHVDTRDKHVIERIEGIDALTLALAQSENGRVLLVGSARRSDIEAITISSTKHTHYLVARFNEPSLHARKIKVKPNGNLYVEAIPFRYNLVAQSGTRQRILLPFRFEKDHYVEIPASPKP